MFACPDAVSVDNIEIGQVVMKRTALVVIVYLMIMALFCAPDSTCAADCPVGDLSGDCMVDLADLAILLDQWLEGSILIGLDMDADAYWPMEEVSGSTTTDYSGNNNTLELINGVSVQTAGPTGSALAFDGVDDFCQSGFVLDPADGPLSVFAWIKGGDDREVILTQTNGTGVGREWLQIDSAGGYLVTRLTDGSTVLKSQTSVTDGDWHHVGVVWDGQRRHLYVDGIKVTYDETPLSENLQFSDGDLYIGTGKSLAADTCWSGMIDEVRIYPVALNDQEVEILATPPQVHPDSADLNGIDGVNLQDLAILAEEWLIGPPGEYRCIWIDSWNSGFLNASQCNNLIQTCRDNNINTVIVEIRKVGDAYYNSSIEPRATNISASFDPLGYLCDIAHDTSGGKKKVEVHAWFVMQRLATSASLNPQHVLSQHPEYAMEDINGNKVSGNSYYIDPGHPGAVDWNVDVIQDCLSKYDIDGINLDYIRYPGSTWGYNATSIARYNAFHGTTGTPSGLAWSDWRRECVTLQVKKVYVKSLMLDPTVVLTADTINWGWGYDNFETSTPYTGVFQDWVGWLREGIIDYNTLMGYTNNATDPDRYKGWCNVSLDNDEKRGSILSTGAYMQDSVQDAMDQLLWARSAGAEGLNIYDWGSEVSRNIFNETRADFYRELKAQVFPEWSDPPNHKWKTKPTTGIFEGCLTVNRSPVDHGTVEIEGQPETRVYTDGSGWYAIMDVVPGNHVLRFSVPGIQENILTQADIPSAGRIITVNVDIIN